SPAGRLPVTFPRSLADMPAFESYAMRGRTYRYLETEPLYPFGFGLSYARFTYSELALSRTRLTHEHDTLDVSVQVTNTGPPTSDALVELCLKTLHAAAGSA